jgi:hypothetical protein
MNGSSAFSRTMRALDADDFRGSKVALFVLGFVLAVWAVWMVAADVPQYETSENALLNVDEDSGAARAIADFPVRAARRIQPGQSAVLEPVGSQHAVAAEVSSITQEGLFVRVTFKVDSAEPSPATTRATARITVDRLSPATIALRALGRNRP